MIWVTPNGNAILFAKRSSGLNFSPYSEDQSHENVLRGGVGRAHRPWRSKAFTRKPSHQHIISPKST
jgi:hypothetical protein